MCHLDLVLLHAAFQRLFSNSVPAWVSEMCHFSLPVWLGWPSIDSGHLLMKPCRRTSINKGWESHCRPSLAEQMTRCQIAIVKNHLWKVSPLARIPSSLHVPANSLFLHTSHGYVEQQQNKDTHTWQQNGGRMKSRGLSNSPFPASGPIQVRMCPRADPSSQSQSPLIHS